MALHCDFYPSFSSYITLPFTLRSVAAALFPHFSYSRVRQLITRDIDSRLDLEVERARGKKRASLIDIPVREEISPPGGARG